MRKVVAILTALLVAGATPASVRIDADDHSDNMKMVGSIDLPGATDVEFTKDGYAVVDRQRLDRAGRPLGRSTSTIPRSRGRSVTYRAPAPATTSASRRTSPS